MGKSFGDLAIRSVDIAHARRAGSISGRPAAPSPATLDAAVRAGASALRAMRAAYPVAMPSRAELGAFERMVRSDLGGLAP